MTVTVELKKNRITIHADRNLRKLDKTIPGANLVKTGGIHWTAPLNMETCKLLRERFRKELVIGPELHAWALAKKKRGKALARIGKASEAELAGLWLSKNPGLWKAVTQGRKYQSAGAKFIATGRRVIVADTVGLGKTAQTLAGIMESQLPGPYLIICPKTPVWSVWEPEIRTWLPNHNVIAAPDGREARNRVLDEFVKNPSHKDFVVVNQEMLRTKAYWLCMNWVPDEEAPKGKRRCGDITWITAGKKDLVCKHNVTKTKRGVSHEYPQLFDVTWSAIIADESDKSLLRKTKLSNQTRRGMELLRLREDGIKVAQSATPWRSRPHLLWSTLNWLYPEEYGSFWAWAETLYDMEEGFEDAKVIGQLNEDRERLLYKTLEAVMIRRTRKEVAPYLPSRMYIGTRYTPGDDTSPHGVWLPMTGKQEAAYRSMEQDAWAEISGGDIEAIGALAELTRLKQFALTSGKMEEGEFKPALPSNKFDYLVDMLQELGFPDDPQAKVIVVSQYTAVLELFAAELAKKKYGSIPSMQLTGKASSKKRAAIKEAFNQTNVGPYLLFMNTIAGGSAITLDAATEMVFLDETFVADDQEQAEGRNDNRRPEERIVQRRYRYLRSMGTVEVGIAFVNQASASEDRRILDERRGVQYLTEVMEESFRQNRAVG